MLVYKADWLATKTLFYNILTDQHAVNNISGVIDYQYFDWDTDGLKNYLDFGYSVMGQTPVRGVKFLQSNEALHQSDQGKLTVDRNTTADHDLHERLLSHSSVEGVIDLLKETVQHWEASVDGDIVLPLSGGFDSRFLLSSLNEKNRLKCFTYGLSDDQSESQEVVHARYLAHKYDIDWHQITLDNYHQYFDEWYRLFGVSTHAHGMYHIEFYHRIHHLNVTSGPFLSGLIGDAWAGSLRIEEVEAPSALIKLGYSHGLNASAQYCTLKSVSNLVLEEYFEQKQQALKSARFRIVEAMRMKMMLLKYLTLVPASFGFSPFAPYLIPDLAINMLRLPDEERLNRKWQRDYFEKIGLNLEEKGLTASPQNTLNTQTMISSPLEPLDGRILNEIIEPNYVAWINRNVLRNTWYVRKWKIQNKLRHKRFIRKFVPRKDVHRMAYAAYLTLYPLQQLIINRNQVLSK